MAAKGFSYHLFITIILCLYVTFVLFFFKVTFGFQKVFSLFRHPTFCLLVPLHCNTAWYENSTESESTQARFQLSLLSWIEVVLDLILYSTSRFFRLERTWYLQFPPRILSSITSFISKISLYFLQFLSISLFSHLISSQSPSFLLNLHTFLHRSKYFIAITLYFSSSGGCILKRNACEFVLLHFLF